MPTPALMTWVHSRRRWTRMYKGRRFWVSCRGLGVPETKEASVGAANRWWRAKQAELDAAGMPVPRAPQPLEDIAAAALGSPPTEFFNKLLAFWGQRKTGSTDAQETAELDMKQIVRGVVAGLLEQNVIDGKPLPDGCAEYLPPARLGQLETAVRGIRGEASAPPNRTIKTHAGAWLTMQESLVAAGQMTAARCANNRTCLEHFQTFLGADADVGTIDAAKLQAFYLFCLAKVSSRRKDTSAGWSIAYARDVFSVAKAFVRWAWEQGAIDLPKNIGSKSFRFGSPAKSLHTWTPEEFKIAVGEAPGKMKLALLLMANAGMTQEDISELRDNEVDWTAGRITRKRTKTAAHDNVPLVCYKLWPITFRLLKEYRSGKERVLLTEQGEPYVRTKLREDGKLSKADGFASNYVHLKRKLNKTMPGFNRPLKELRKLGATLLESHKDYGRFKSYFLGHSPRTVADRHYAAPSQELFDEAVAWIGRQLGQVRRSARA